MTATQYGLKSYTVETQQKILDLAVLNKQQELLVTQVAQVRLQIEVLEAELKNRGAI